MASRKSLSPKRRFEIFKRDGFVCQYCGGHPPHSILHVDHIVAVANGGDNADNNLVTACSSCNQGKSATPLEVVPVSLAEKAAIVQEKEAQLKGYYAIMKNQQKRLDSDVWEVIDALYPVLPEKIREDWFQSIKRFVERLGKFEAVEAALLAKAKIYWSDSRRFKYFCGVCWCKLRAVEGRVNGEISSATVMDG